MKCENCERLRAERNRLVDTTELGAVSERLEEENAAADASTVRSAMHELYRLRAAPSSGVVDVEKVVLYIETWGAHNGERVIAAKMVRDLKSHPFWAALFTRKGTP
jgi:hypothetical protein